MMAFNPAFMRDYRPDYSSVFSGSAHDAWTLLVARKNLVLTMLIGLAVVTAIAGLAGGWNFGFNVEGAKAGTFPPSAYLADAAYYLAVMVLAFFALADSVRTVRPDFTLTFGGVLGLLGWSLVVGVIVDIGFLLFVIPGLYFFVKLSQAVYAYFLRPGENPVGRSWEATNGHFWQTAGFYLLISIFIGIGMMLPFYIAFGGIYLFPPAAIVLIPFVFGIWGFMVYFNQLIHVRWTEALLRAHEMKRDLAPVPATP